MADRGGRIEKFSLVLNTVADWFLIIGGLVLICWALVSIDVTSARYLLVMVGILLSGSGCWFRRLGMKRRSSTRSRRDRQ